MHSKKAKLWTPLLTPCAMWPAWEVCRLHIYCDGEGLGLNGGTGWYYDRCQMLILVYGCTEGAKDSDYPLDLCLYAEADLSALRSASLQGKVQRHLDLSLHICIPRGKLCERGMGCFSVRKWGFNSTLGQALISKECGEIKYRQNYKKSDTEIRFAYKKQL